MSKSNSSRYDEVETTLALLTTLEEDGSPSQRGLAQRIGVALGLANALVKRCLAKGLIKINQAPARRYAYYLTPEGFAEKAHLVRQYLDASLTFFRRARLAYEVIFEQLSKSDKNVGLVGGGELAEIALLSCGVTGMKATVVVVPGSNNRSFLDIPVVPAIADIRKTGCDAVVITDSVSPQETYEELLAHFTDDQIYAPGFMHIRRISDKATKDTAA